MVMNALIRPHMAYFVVVIQFQELSKFSMKAINLLHMGNVGYWQDWLKKVKKSFDWFNFWAKYLWKKM